MQEVHVYEITLQNQNVVVIETVKHHDDYPGESFWTNVLRPLLSSPVLAQAMKWRYVSSKRGR